MNPCKQGFRAYVANLCIVYQTHRKSQGKMRKLGIKIKHTMPSKPKNTTYVYIDANNLYQGIRYYFDWRLDYKKFYTFLMEKYRAENVYLFIGYIPEYYWLYKKLQRIGFRLIFKEITKDEQGNIKGNCDADMVLQIVQDYYENKINNINAKAVLVTADGDYASTIKFLRDRDALEVVLAPCSPYIRVAKKTHRPLSFLIRKLRVPIIYISKYQTRLKK